MKESLPEGFEFTAGPEASVQAPASPAPVPEDGADPDQYLWGV